MTKSAVLSSRTPSRTPSKADARPKTPKPTRQSQHAKAKAKSSIKPSIKPNAQAKVMPVLSADDVITDFSRVNLITITPNQDGQRIDNFLLARLKGLPRSHLYKLIRDDEIRINKKRCKPHDRVSTGDVVRIAPVRLSVREAPVIGDEFGQGLLARIIYEDEGLMVFNKPHGMAVHGGSGESFGVIEALRVASGKKYLELIHRIDKDTSGLLLIAKKRSTLKQLQEQFRQKTINKDYLCLVHGSVKGDQSVIDKPLLKYTLPNGEHRVKIDASGKPSQTHIKVLARFEIDGRAVSLVKASPKTGRTHQIRVHMASLGHALLGDDKYQTPAQKSQCPTVIKRLCLHAWQLHLADDGTPQARPSQFQISPPDDLMALLDGSVGCKFDKTWQ